MFTLCSPLFRRSSILVTGTKMQRTRAGGRRNRDNSWLQFNGFIQSTEAPPLLHIHKAEEGIIPQQVHLSHVFLNTLITVQQFHIIYIYSQVLASIIHPRTSPIIFHIIHIPFPYYKYVRSCQERRLD